jgi:hypothetical protein
MVREPWENKYGFPIRVSANDMHKTGQAVTAGLCSHMLCRYPHIEAVFVLNAALTHIPSHQVGEIVSVGPSLTKGHWHAKACLSRDLRLRRPGIRVS